MKCELCQKNEARVDHHFNGKDIFPEKLGELEDKYYELEKEHGKKGKADFCVPCHATLHGNAMKKREIRIEYYLFKRAQEARKAIKNQIRGFKYNELKIPEWFKNLISNLKSTEGKYRRGIKKRVRNLPVWGKWSELTEGVGEITIAAILSYVDWEKTPKPSNLWSYCGQAPGQKKRKGNNVNWNPTLRAQLYAFGDAVVKEPDSFYERIYRKKKEELQKREPVEYDVKKDKNKIIGDIVAEGKYEGCRVKKTVKNKNEVRYSKLEGKVKIKLSDGHIHKMSMRQARKIFLAHVYMIGRKKNGLPLSEPYVAEDGTKHNITKPPHWKEIFEQD